MAHITNRPLSRIVLTGLVSVLVTLPISLAANTPSPSVASAKAGETLSREAILELIQAGRGNEAVAGLQAELARAPANLALANHLAVVLTGLGQPNAAREVLEQALLAHPETATTFKNLRELAALQFAESYAKALGQRPPPKKLALEGGSNLSPDDVRRAQAVADERARAKARADVLAKAEADRLARAEAAKLAQAQPASPGHAAVEAAVSGDLTQQITLALESWAKAWAAKDFDRYASFYAKSYKTPEYPSREKWLAFRQPRIMKKERIVVQISAVEVSDLGSDRVEVRFGQRYEAGALKVKARKRQVWVRESGHWRIQSESN